MRRWCQCLCDRKTTTTATATRRLCRPPSLLTSGGRASDPASNLAQSTLSPPQPPPPCEQMRDRIFAESRCLTKLRTACRGRGRCSRLMSLWRTPRFFSQTVKRRRASDTVHTPQCDRPIPAYNCQPDGTFKLTRVTNRRKKTCQLRYVVC